MRKKAYVDTFYILFPDHRLRKAVEQNEEFINYELENFKWKFTINALNSTYKLNTPILINSTLTNRSKIAKTITVFRHQNKYSNFQLELIQTNDPEANSKSIEDNVPMDQIESVRQDSIIQPGQGF